MFDPQRPATLSTKTAAASHSLQLFRGVRAWLLASGNFGTLYSTSENLAALFRALEVPVRCHCVSVSIVSG